MPARELGGGEVTGQHGRGHGAPRGRGRCGRVASHGQQADAPRLDVGRVVAARRPRVRSTPGREACAPRPRRRCTRRPRQARRRACPESSSSAAASSAWRRGCARYHATLPGNVQARRSRCQIPIPWPPSPITLRRLVSGSDRPQQHRRELDRPLDGRDPRPLGLGRRYCASRSASEIGTSSSWSVESDPADRHHGLAGAGVERQRAAGVLPREQLEVVIDVQRGRLPAPLMIDDWLDAAAGMRCCTTAIPPAADPRVLAHHQVAVPRRAGPERGPARRSSSGRRGW